MGRGGPSESERRSAAGVPTGAGAGLRGWGVRHPACLLFLLCPPSFLDTLTRHPRRCACLPWGPGKNEKRKRDESMEAAAQAMLRALCGDSLTDPSRRALCAMPVASVLSRMRGLRHRAVVTCPGSRSCGWGTWYLPTECPREPGGSGERHG